MADSTAIAIVSVSVAGVTALATPALVGWLESRREARRFNRELAMRDIAELRGLLDDALVAFDEAFGRRAQLTKRWMVDSLADCTELIADVQIKRNRAQVLKARLETRLGPHHAISEAYDEAIERFDDAVNPLVAAHVEAAMSHTLDSRPTEEARTAAASVIQRSVTDMNDAMDRFGAEAHKLAGLRLDA